MSDDVFLKGASVKIVLNSYEKRDGKIRCNPWIPRRLPHLWDYLFTAWGQTRVQITALSFVDDRYLQHSPSVVRCSKMNRLNTAAAVATFLNDAVYVVYVLPVLWKLPEVYKMITFFLCPTLSSSIPSLLRLHFSYFCLCCTCCFKAASASYTHCRIVLAVPGRPLRSSEYLVSCTTRIFACSESILTILGPFRWFNYLFSRLDLDRLYRRHTEYKELDVSVEWPLLQPFIHLHRFSSISSTACRHLLKCFLPPLLCLKVASIASWALVQIPYAPYQT